MEASQGQTGSLTKMACRTGVYILPGTGVADDWQLSSGVLIRRRGDSR